MFRERRNRSDTKDANEKSRKTKARCCNCCITRKLHSSTANQVRNYISRCLCDMFTCYRHEGRKVSSDLRRVSDICRTLDEKAEITANPLLPTEQPVEESASAEPPEEETVLLYSFVCLFMTLALSFSIVLFHLSSI